MDHAPPKLQALCVHEAFERVAEKHADRDAVVCGPSRWTYARLNEQANRIAHALIAMGVTREQPIAIALPRSCEAIAAMLGVLKAGAAYIPIVDNQPVARLRKMLADSGCSVLIGEDGHLPELHAHVSGVLTIDRCAQHPAHNPGLACSPSDLAYVMYTSGSTGEPKGVMIEHDGVIRLVHDQWFMPTGPDVNYLCVSSLGFDASTIEIYAALLHGARLALSHQRVPEPAQIARLIREESVKAVWIAFGFFGALFEADPGMFDPVETIMTGGEPVTGGLIRRAQQRLAGATFVNSYGPTECTALSTAYVIPRDFSDEHPSLPIGRALRGMRLYVLGGDGQPVARGEQGELHIGGVGVGRGYLNAPELTRVKFLPDPFGAESGARMYRTGDRVRELSDGQLLFMGRIDDQVKVRGNRLELGEVEAVASSLPGVRRCAAAVVETRNGQRVGLLVVGDGEKLGGASIVDQMSQKLPEYMAPAAVAFAGEVPINRNGKVDRDKVRALIEAGGAFIQTGAGDPLTTDTERDLAELMSAVLSTPVTSRDDEFLRLGGHSLRAVVLCSRVRDRFGVELPVSVLYALASVGGIGAYIDAQAGQGDQRDAIEPVELGERAELSFNQQRLWMLSELNPEDPSYNITIRLDSDHALDRESFERAWASLCERQDALRSRIVVADDKPWQTLAQAPRVRWVDAPAQGVEALDALIGEEASKPITLSDGPLVRCLVFERGEGVAIVITMHHIVSDAWSCEILRRELAELYAAEIAGRDAALPDLPVRYAQYAHWERALPDRSSYANDLAYWSGQLGGCEAVELPADHPRPAAPAPGGQRVACTLNPEEAAQIRRAAVELGVTPFAYLLGVFKVWLHRLTLSEDLVVGTPIANRERSEIEGLVGFFMETAALRTPVSCDDTLRDVITRVSRVALEAFDHRDVPFQHIVEAVQRRGAEGRNPLFEIFFNHIAIRLRDERGAERGEGQPRFSSREVENGTAKFDLTCYVFDPGADIGEGGGKGEGMEIVFNTRSALFEAATARRFLGQYTALLRASVAHMDCPVSQIAVLAESEPEPSLAKIPDQHDAQRWARTGVITGFVRQSVQRRPDAIAVISQGGSLTYRQLWDRSASIAQMLLERGMAPGQRVVVGAGDAAALAPIILGVLRAGGVYVPLDTGWPPARVAQVVRLASPACVVTDRELHARFGVGAMGLESIIVEDVGAAQGELAEPELHPDSPAYMLFTSGSTGTPKGVVQSHGAVVGHMLTFANSVGLTEDDRLLQVSSPAFDAAVMDVFSAWFTGASLCVCDLQRTDPQGLARFIDENRVSVYHSAPTVLRWLSSGLGEQARFDSVRAVVLGGEPVGADDTRAVGARFNPSARFINGLGLSESSLTLQLRTTVGDLGRYSRWVPVGRPVEGVSVRLLDHSGRETTLCGEIEIESDRIALGYWDPDSREVRPIGEATAGGKRRYRTGDLGMTLADGSIMHIGRRDHQVQVHGCRVEPGEVAAALKALDGVEDSAVLAEKTESGDHELTAFVVLADGGSGDESALRSQLAQRVPSYMTPARMLRVLAIPRVGGGKLDRAALREAPVRPWDDGAGTDGGEVSPTARAIAKVFARVLEVPEFGPHDGFFRHGGNSLKAIRVFARLRKELGAELPISAIYRAPTPAMLAREIDAFAQRAGEEVALITFSRSPGAPRVYVLPGIGGHPLGFGPLVAQLGEACSCVGVQYPNEQAVRAMGATLPALASWLIGKMDLGPGARSPDMIGYSFGGSLALEVAMQLQQRGHAPGRLVLLDAHLPQGLPKKGRVGTLLTHATQIIRGGEQGRVAYVLSRLRPGGAKPTLTSHPLSTPQDRPEDKVVDNHEEPLDDQSVLWDYKAVARINRAMVIAYRPQGRYRGPVLLIQARQPDWLCFHHDDGFNGFRDVIEPGSIERREINATHLNLFKPGFVEQIAAHVRHWLRET